MLEQTNWEREQSDAVVGTRLAELEAENRELRKHYTLRGGAQSLFHLMLTLDEATIQQNGFVSDGILALTNHACSLLGQAGKERRARWWTGG